MDTSPEKPKRQRKTLEQRLASLREEQASLKSDLKKERDKADIRLKCALAGILLSKAADGDEKTVDALLSLVDRFTSAELDRLQPQDFLSRANQTSLSASLLSVAVRLAERRRDDAEARRIALKKRFENEAKASGRPLSDSETAILDRARAAYNKRCDDVNKLKGSGASAASDATPPDADEADVPPTSESKPRASDPSDLFEGEDRKVPAG